MFTGIKATEAVAVPTTAPTRKPADASCYVAQVSDTWTSFTNTCANKAGKELTENVIPWVPAKTVDECKYAASTVAGGFYASGISWYKEAKKPASGP